MIHQENQWRCRVSLFLFLISPAPGHLWPSTTPLRTFKCSSVTLMASLISLSSIFSSRSFSSTVRGSVPALFLACSGSPPNLSMPVLSSIQSQRSLSSVLHISSYAASRCGYPAYPRSRPNGVAACLLDPKPNQVATSNPTNNPYTTLPVRMGLTTLTRGPRNGSSGSNNPHSDLVNVLDKPSASLAVLDAWADLPLRSRFLPFTILPAGAVPDRGRLDTAAFRLAKRSLPYCVWPSFAPLSIAPKSGESV